jgi:hypothetical protein
MPSQEITIVEELVEETRGLLTRGKELLVKVAYNLKALKDSGEWEKYGHDTFPKFCQEELDLSQSNTTKYLTIAEYFSEKFSPEDIGPVAIENLYLASKLPGDLEENLAKAKTWRREDFKQDKAETTPHEFARVCYCSVCGLSEERHP